jgi:hypothetical protein
LQYFSRVYRFTGSSRIELKIEVLPPFYLQYYFTCAVVIQIIKPVILPFSFCPLEVYVPPSFGERRFFMFHRLN